MRSFAKDLDLSPSFLSRVLAGKKTLSADTWVRVSERLGTYFKPVTSADTAAPPVQDLSIEAFKLIRDWAHFATLSLIDLTPRKISPAYVGKRLSIPEFHARQILQRLEKLGMIEIKKGKVTNTGTFFVDPKGTPSQYVREFHEQVLEMAKKAIHFQAPVEREYGTNFVALAEKDLPEAKKMIRDFRTAFDTRFSSSAQKDPKGDVYALGVQLFRISQKE
jgi:uncharacterized protein (TIGR02147 family)